MNAGQKLRNPEADHVPTPNWLMVLYRDWFDPYYLGSHGVLPVPASPCKVFMNPGFSRADSAVDWAIELHKMGYTVHMLIPIETSTRRAKKLIQYGCQRLYFEKRIYENVRGVELVILTG
jgi:hypothetical protein